MSFPHDSLIFLKTISKKFFIFIHYSKSDGGVAKRLHGTHVELASSIIGLDVLQNRLLSANPYNGRPIQPIQKAAIT